MRSTSGPELPSENSHDIPITPVSQVYNTSEHENILANAIESVSLLPVHVNLEAEACPSSAIVPFRQGMKLAETTIRTYWCGLGRIQNVKTQFNIQDDDQDSSKSVEKTRIFLPNRFTARLRLNGFRFQSTKLLGQWTYCFTSLHLVPKKAPIFAAVKRGDLAEIISLIKRKEASIFDVDDKGWTLLHVGTTEILLNARADADSVCSLLVSTRCMPLANCTWS